jgi:hypothetical protein
MALLVALLQFSLLAQGVLKPSRKPLSGRWVMDFVEVSEDEEDRLERTSQTVEGGRCS